MSFQVEGLGPQMVAEGDFVAEGVEGAPREDGEVEGGEVGAEGALEEGIRSWLNHTDMKVCNFFLFVLVAWIVPVVPFVGLATLQRCLCSDL